MEPTTASQPLKVLIWVLIVAGLALSIGGLWSGTNTLLADRRIKAAGLSEAARVVSLQEPRRSTSTLNNSSRLGWVSYELLSQPNIRHSLSIRRTTWENLRVGQTITILVDPHNPNNHQFDRAQQIRLAWMFLALGLVLAPCSLGLAVWAIRGGMSGLQASP